MTKSGAYLLTALWLLVPIYATHAQSHLAPGSFASVPLNDHAYQDASILRNAGFIDYRNWAFSPETGTFSGTKIKTRYEFAVVITGFLDDKRKSEAYDAKLRQDPKVLAALNRLLQQFESPIAKLGVNIPAARSRLAVLGVGFPDVPLDHWAFQSVEALRKTGIIIGYPTRNFRPRGSRK